MGRKNHKHQTTEHYGKGRLRAAEYGKGRKVQAAMKRAVVEIDFDALALEVRA